MSIRDSFDPRIPVRAQCNGCLHRLQFLREVASAAGGRGLGKNMAPQPTEQAMFGDSAVPSAGTETHLPHDDRNNTKI